MTSTTTATTVNGTGSAAQRERRQRMLEATIELASQGGFEAVQMRAVAERADVALGTLYRYFPSKIHLLVTALGRQFAAAEAACHAADRAVKIRPRMRSLSPGSSVTSGCPPWSPGSPAARPPRRRPITWIAPSTSSCADLSHLLRKPSTCRICSAGSPRPVASARLLARR